MWLSLVEYINRF